MVGFAVLLSIIVVTNTSQMFVHATNTQCHVILPTGVQQLPSISKYSMWANIPMFHSQTAVLSWHSGYHDDIVWTDMYSVSHGANAKYVWTLVPVVAGSAVCLVHWAPQGPVWNVRTLAPSVYDTRSVNWVGDVVWWFQQFPGCFSPGIQYCTYCKQVTNAAWGYGLVPDQS